MEEINQKAFHSYLAISNPNKKLTKEEIKLWEILKLHAIQFSLEQRGNIPDYIQERIEDEEVYL